MNATIKVLFYTKRAKSNSQGLIPVFLRLTIQGKRIDKSTGKFVLPEKWNTETSRLKGNSEDSRVLTPIKQEYYSKFRLLIMRLIFSLKLDAYPGSISRLV